MACTCPVEMWPPPPGAADRRFVYSPMKSYEGARSILRPCNQCVSCRLAYSRNWAIRITHEAKTAGPSSFVTPTYDDAHVPSDGSVSVREHQLFMKRVRDRFGAVRFFGVGEYGAQGSRPHYHTALFGLFFEDRSLWGKSPKGQPLYRSASLEACWDKGQILIQDLSPGNAEYIARYSLKKLDGGRDADRYRRRAIVPETGEVREWFVQREFAVMSRKPGLGSEWYRRFGGTDISNDYVVIQGQKRPVPKFYTDKRSTLERLAISAERKSSARAHADNNTERRLLTRTEFMKLKARDLKRSYEEGG